MRDTDSLNSKKRKHNDGEEAEDSDDSDAHSSSSDSEQSDTESEEEEFTPEMLEKTGSISKLPIEIFIEVLSRLPVKSMCHCRWVSKAWYNTIKHPRFVKAHHAKVIKSNSHSLIVLEKKHHKQIDLIDHQSLDAFETKFTLYTPKLPIPMRQIYSCNGLVFSRKYPFFVCNPITGEKMEIPERSVYFDRKDVKCGFGFAPQSQVFKIVRLVDVVVDFAFETDAEVYNCAMGDWSVISNVPYFFSLFDSDKMYSNVCVNGTLHWIGVPNAEAEIREVIVSFNLDTEEFQEVTLPPGFEFDTREFRQYLVVLGDCLCIVHNVGTEHIEIWVMKDYGVESSWFKEYSIKDVDLDGVIAGPYKPIKLMSNGDILLLCSGQSFGYYDPKEKTFTYIDFDVFLFWNPDLEPVLHMGSLISPRICGN